MFDYLNNFVIKHFSPTKFLKKVRLEACTLCQLNCKSCYMRLQNSGSVENGYLTFENFKFHFNFHFCNKF